MADEPKIDKNSSETARNIYEELSSRTVGVLATIGFDSAPYLSVVYFSVDDDFTIRFATKEGTRKHQNLAKNHAVKMLVYDEETQLTIQVKGRAHPVSDRTARSEAIEKMYAASEEANHDMPPVAKLQAGSFVVYEIRPQRISMAMFMRPQRGGFDMIEALDFENPTD